MSELRFKRLVALGHDADDLVVQEIQRASVAERLKQLAQAIGGNMMPSFGAAIAPTPWPGEWQPKTETPERTALDRELFVSLATIRLGRLEVGLQAATRPRPMLRLFGLPTLRSVDPPDAQEEEFDIDADELVLRLPEDGDDVAIVLADGSVIGIAVTTNQYHVTRVFPALRSPGLVEAPLAQWHDALAADPWLQSRLNLGEFGPASPLTQWERAGEVLRFSVDRETDVGSPLTWSRQQDPEQHALLERAIDSIATSLLLDMNACTDPDEFDLLEFCEARETLESLRVMIPGDSPARIGAEEEIAEVDERAEALMLAGRPLDAWTSETRWQRSVLSNWDAWWNGGWLAVPPEPTDAMRSDE